MKGETKNEEFYSWWDTSTIPQVPLVGAVRGTGVLSGKDCSAKAG